MTLEQMDRLNRARWAEDEAYRMATTEPRHSARLPELLKAMDATRQERIRLELEVLAEVERVVSGEEAA